MPRRPPTRLRLAAPLAVVAGLCAPVAAASPGDLSFGSASPYMSLGPANLSLGQAASHMSLGPANLSLGQAASYMSLGPANLSLGPAMLAPATATASAPAEVPPELAGVAAAIAGAEEVASAAEAAARREDQRSASELARRLVTGQVMLTHKDSERAAVVFLDLLENAPGTPAAAQARFYLGEALLQLGMRRWAAECFSGTLADPSADARRLHQGAVARLLGLASPSRSAGHARRPGLGALPELRARLQSLGLVNAAPQIPAEAPRGELGPTDVLRLRGWVAAIAPDQRSAELRYAHGRHLFLSRDYSAAFAELDAVAPLDQALDIKARDGRWRLRATYIAAAAALALGQVDLAFERFDRLVTTRVRAPDDREIRDLAWLGRARIHSDRGEPAEALRAYRQIGRDSPLFAEAMYEAAWALLRAGRPEVAVAALDLVLSLAPDGPIAPEALQLRGKLQIQQRAWKAAAVEFAALRGDFEARARALAGALSVEADAAAYYSAVARSDGREFKLDALLPRGALGLARGLRRAAQAEQLARETGAVDSMLGETRELLARMETAAQASELPRLFVDLGAHWTAIDSSHLELVDAGEQLLTRGGTRPDPAQRRGLDALRTGRSARARKISDLGELVPPLADEAAALRARVVGLERAQLASGRPRSATFFSEAAALRSELADSEAALSSVHARLTHARATLRFTDPLDATRRAELGRYRGYLAGVLDSAAAATREPAVRALFTRLRRAQTRLDAARDRLEIAANKRLAAAVIVLREEHANLERYAAELAELRERALLTFGQTAAAAMKDLSADLRYWTIRSEVGQLDVAWAVQHAEQDEAERLERSRDQGFKELDRALDQVLEDME